MNIYGLNYIDSSKNFNTSLITQKPSINFRAKLLTQPEDYFIKNTNNIVRQAFSKLKKINRQEYNLLSDIEKKALKDALIAESQSSKNIHDFFKDIKIHDFASECIKQACDSEFGSNNYVIITIGRSLSSIGKLLSFKIGEDNVKNIALSNLSNVKSKDNEPFEHFYKTADTEAFKDYLKTCGLTKEKINSSNKKFIIIDYAYTGNSIKNAYKILTSDYYLGNENKNITFSTIQEFLPTKGYKQDCAILLTNLMFGTFKTYSNVNRLNSYNKEEIKKSSTSAYLNYPENKKYFNRLFGFMMLDYFYSDSYPKANYKLQLNNTPLDSKQKIFKWLSPNIQFNKDVFIDLYELDKAILRTDNKELKEKMKSLKWKLKEASPNIYYAKLKDMVDKAINC